MHTATGTSRCSGSRLIAVLWIGYFVLEGFDFGVGTLLPFLGQATTPTGASIINTIGPVWDGNEVWLLDRRRRHVRGVPRLVRDALLGLLPRALPDPRRADRPRRRVRVPRQARLRPLAGVVGPRDLRRLGAAGAALGRRVRQHRPRRPDRRGTASTPAPSSRCSIPTRSLGGPHVADPLHAARRDLPVAQDQGRAGRARARGGAPALDRGRRARLRVPALDVPERRLGPRRGHRPRRHPAHGARPRDRGAVPRARGPRRARVRRDGAHDRARSRHDLPQPLPAGARVVEHEQGVRPDDLVDELDALHAGRS